MPVRVFVPAEGTIVKACPFCSENLDNAATVCPHCNWELDEAPAPAPSRLLWRSAMTAGVVVLLTMIGAFGSTLIRARSHQGTPSLPAPAPERLADIVENLPANSWKAVPLNVPRDGVLNLEVGVDRGNPVNVFVTTADDLQRMQGDDVTTVRRHPGFAATMTKQFRGEAQLTAGNYYLVLQDPSMVASSASAVSIEANLRR